MPIRHSVIVTGPESGDQVSVEAWNENHYGGPFAPDMNDIEVVVTQGAGVIDYDVNDSRVVAILSDPSELRPAECSAIILSTRITFGASTAGEAGEPINLDFDAILTPLFGEDAHVPDWDGVPFLVAAALPGTAFCYLVDGQLRDITNTPITTALAPGYSIAFTVAIVTEED